MLYFGSVILWIILAVCSKKQFANIINVRHIQTKPDFTNIPICHKMWLSRKTMTPVPKAFHGLITILSDRLWFTSRISFVNKACHIKVLELKVFSRLGSSTNEKVLFQTGFTLFILVSVFFFPHGLSRTSNWTYGSGVSTRKVIIRFQILIAG